MVQLGREKPQLCMKGCKPRPQRMAQTLIQGQPVQDASGDNEVAHRPDHREQIGAFWQLSKKTDMRRSTVQKDLVRALENSHDGRLRHITDQVRAKGRTFKRTDLSMAP